MLLCNTPTVILIYGRLIDAYWLVSLDAEFGETERNRNLTSLVNSHNGFQML